MSLLARRRRPEGEARERVFGFTEFVNQWMVTGSGSAVTRTSVQSLDVALSNSVVWRCAMKNAATIASFPVHTHRNRDVIADPMIVADPQGDGSLRSSWVFGSVLSMYLRGGANWYISTVEGSATRAARATLLHPDRVGYSDREGWTLDDKPVDLWPLGPLYHVPMYVLPGSPKGLNPLQFAARSLFPGMAAQDFGGNFFRDGAHPTSIISPEKDPGKEGADTLKKRVMEATSGTNREPLVLPQNIKWTQMQVNPEDSQFIETMKLSDEQVCRYMGTPPTEIGIAPSGASVTYANREQSKQDYLQELLYPIGQIEASWSSLIARPQYVKLNPDGLLRADLKTRYESYRIAAEIEQMAGKPLLDVDEMRELENRPELPDVEDPPGGDPA